MERGRQQNDSLADGCLKAIHHNLEKRVRDMQKNIEGADNELQSLTRMTEVINTKQLEDVYNAVEKNTKKLVDACKANERAAASLEVMQVPSLLSKPLGGPGQALQHAMRMVAPSERQHIKERQGKSMTKTNGSCF